MHGYISLLSADKVQVFRSSTAVFLKLVRSKQTI